MPLFADSLTGWVHPSDAFVLLFASHPHCFWLDREHHQDDRYSIIGGSSGPVISGDRQGVRSLLEKAEHSAQPQVPFDFRPGLVGVFGFEPQSDLLLEVDRAIVFDHDKQHIWFIGEFESQRDFDDWMQAALLRFALVGGQQAQYRDLHAGGDVWAPQLRHDSSRYIELIQRAQDHIRWGDVYQLCLTNEVTIETSVDPLLTFLRLREQNPAPYAAFMRVEGTSVVSASPEQFLKLDSQGWLSSKPIKGTRKRGANPEEDAAIAQELRANEKERAENLMIVDLMRNDFGRVCEVGSVDVPKLFDVETYATVHQLVSTVRGKLTSAHTALDAILAAFPGGSMTGAPKQRAIEIIQDLEQGNRGIYSGALGYISPTGSAEFGMVIRTLVFRNGTATLGVGGGITIDSDPRAELEETKLKAKALLRALGADDPWANEADGF
jgi:para-aminobenzoate synthetase